jgi:hypothetical protein
VKRPLAASRTGQPQTDGSDGHALERHPAHLRQADEHPGHGHAHPQLVRRWDRPIDRSVGTQDVVAQMAEVVERERVGQQMQRIVTPVVHGELGLCELRSLEAGAHLDRLARHVLVVGDNLRR